MPFDAEPANRHWTRNLPEAGAEVLERAAAIEAMRAQLAELQAHIAAEEAAAERTARASWSSEEIAAAKGTA